MRTYSGRFQYSGESTESVTQGPCQVSFDEETCVVTPAGGVPIAFDLGDIERVTPGTWDLQLELYTGGALTLKQFGAAFSGMSGELLAAWTDRTVRCLLLEDLEELGRYRCTVNGAPCELRIFKSNIAVLPESGAAFQWRLAELDSLHFDEASYSITLARGQDRLTLSRLAKKTGEALDMLRGALMRLREDSATTLHGLFPFLTPEQLVRMQLVMREGCSVSLAALNEIHPEAAEALIARAVDDPLRPYFEALRSRAANEPLMAGYKFVREEEDGAGGEASLPLVWFWIPLSDGIAAWEATTGSGRATYFFRSPAPFGAAVESLTHGLALVNFRREPVYLPDDALDRQPRYHRYAIGARKLPELRQLRAAYIGRAVHSSPDEWRAQVDAVLAAPSPTR